MVQTTHNLEKFSDESWDGFDLHLSKAVATTKAAKLRQASKQLSESKVRNGRDLECESKGYLDISKGKNIGKIL